MEKIRERIYLASLLHDIGKFYQRADRGSVHNSLYLHESEMKLSYCPMNAGKYSHKHVLWTAQFIEDFYSVFGNLLQEDPRALASDGSGLLDLAAGHHLPSYKISQWGNLIKEADCLSSGMDRGSMQALKDSDDETNKTWDSFKRKCMVSILQTIDTHHQAMNGKDTWRHLPVDKLHLSKDFFPQSTYPNPDYERLWNEFKNEFIVKKKWFANYTNGI